MKKAVAVLGLAFLVFSASAKIEMGTPFSDGAVLQRETKVPVWGKVTPPPGKSSRIVSVSFGEQEKAASVDALTGVWKVELGPLAASKEGRTMTVREQVPGLLWDACEDEIEIKDILVGEVWMCAGQSNTDCPIWGDDPHYRDGQGSTILQMTVKPWVRLVKTPGVPATRPKRDVKVEWMPMTPDLLKVLAKGRRLPSAMGYFFALELANALDIPIGLVDSSWGGTNIDAWTPASGYDGMDALKDVAALPQLSKDDFRQARASGVYKGLGIYGSWIQQPSVLWNGMVAAFTPMACRGFIWYQGCHNGGEARRYCDKMHALYNGWSKEFANPGLKLYFVQLAPWGKGWYAMDLAQAKFEREEKNAAMAIINDVGCLTDIHPNDKRTVARRLALHALKRDYGFDGIVDNSPTLKSWKIDGNKFVLSFNDAKKWHLYNTDWSAANGFEVCGTNGVWTAATIENLKGTEESGRMHGKCRGVISGSDLVVSAKDVTDPVKLRYLFQKPWFGNLYSEFALPLGAFEISK